MSLFPDEDNVGNTMMFQNIWESLSAEEKEAMMEITGADLGPI